MSFRWPAPSNLSNGVNWVTAGLGGSSLRSQARRQRRDCSQRLAPVPFDVVQTYGVPAVPQLIGIGLDKTGIQGRCRPRHAFSNNRALRISRVQFMRDVITDRPARPQSGIPWLEGRTQKKSRLGGNSSATELADRGSAPARYPDTHITKGQAPRCAGHGGNQERTRRCKHFARPTWVHSATRGRLGSTRVVKAYFCHWRLGRFWFLRRAIGLSRWSRQGDDRLHQWSGLPGCEARSIFRRFRNRSATDRCGNTAEQVQSMRRVRRVAHEFSQQCPPSETHGLWRAHPRAGKHDPGDIWPC